jgi:hypothetical protein
VTLSHVIVPGGRVDEAREILERFRAPAEPGIDEVVRAEALAELGRVLVLSGSLEEGGPLIEQGLETLEFQQAWHALAAALISRAVYLIYRRRREEGVGVLRQALLLAEKHGLSAVALRARFNLAAASIEVDRHLEAIEEVNEGLALARERGDRASERQLLGQQLAPLALVGRWDEAVAVGEVLLAGEVDLESLSAAAFLASVAAARGDDEVLARCVAIANPAREATYVDWRACAHLALGRDALERGAPDEALRLARAVLPEESTGGEFRTEAYSQSIEAATALGDERAMAELVAVVDALPPALATPLLRAGRARLAAEQAHRDGDSESAARHEEEAIGILRAVGARPLLARALLERVRRRQDPQALAEARSIYGELAATRWLAAIDEASGVAA